VACVEHGQVKYLVLPVFLAYPRHGSVVEAGSCQVVSGFGEDAGTVPGGRDQARVANALGP
jgi:hypothetical protein